MKKVLIVDDCPVVLEMMNNMLAELHYEVTTARNGSEACKEIDQFKYDMIFTDLKMPVMDGFEFVQQAKQMPNCKFVPIVMLSGEEDESKISKAKQIGISTFLKKPIKRNQLETIMQVVLGS